MDFVDKRVTRGWCLSTLLRIWFSSVMVEYYKLFYMQRVSLLSEMKIAVKCACIGGGCKAVLIPRLFGLAFQTFKLIFGLVFLIWWG